MISLSDVNRTPSHVTFLASACTHNSVAHDSGSRCLSASRHPCFMRSGCFDSLRLSILHSSPSLPSSSSFSWFSSSSSMWVGSGRSTLCASANEELGIFGREQSSHRLWAQHHRQLPDLRDHWNLHPGVLQRHQALELAWLGDQWLHHRQSALFTTVHSASRGQAYHSLDESLLSSQSLSVGHVGTGRPVSDEFGSPISNVRENPRRGSENEHIRILLETTKKSRFLLIIEQRFKNTSPRPIMTEENIQKLNGVMTYPVSTRWNLSCSSRRRTTSTRSTTYSWTIIGTKSGSS